MGILVPQTYIDLYITIQTFTSTQGVLSLHISLLGIMNQADDKHFSAQGASSLIHIQYIFLLCMMKQADDKHFSLHKVLSPYIYLLSIMKQADDKHCSARSALSLIHIQYISIPVPGGRVPGLHGGKGAGPQLPPDPSSCPCKTRTGAVEKPAIPGD